MEDDYDEDSSKDSEDDVDVVVPVARRKDLKYKDKEGNEGTKEKFIYKLRACMHCRVIMSEDQFFSLGCPNCPQLDLAGNLPAVQDCTSSDFTGIVAILNPAESWVARYNGLVERAPGCYAVNVLGNLVDSQKYMRED